MSSQSCCELVGDDLGDLADGEALVVAAVEDLAHRVLGLVDRQQQGVGQVVDVAEGDEAEPVVGQHEERAAVEDAPHDAPLPRRQLPGPVDVGVAEVGCRGVGLEQELLGAADAVALAVVVLGGERSVLPERHRQAGRLVDGRVEEALVDGHPAHRDDAAGAALQHVGDRAEPAVGGEGDVEGLVAEGLAQAVVAEHVAVQVAQVGDLGNLVVARVQHRDVVAALLEPAGDGGPGRSGPPDQQHLGGHRRRLPRTFVGRARRAVPGPSGWRRTGRLDI